MELLNLGVKWEELKKEKNEKQYAGKFVKIVKQLNKRIDYLLELERPVNELIIRGWKVSDKSLRFRAAPQHEKDCLADFHEQGLETNDLEDRIRQLDNNRVNSWLADPVSGTHARRTLCSVVLVKVETVSLLNFSSGSRELASQVLSWVNESLSLACERISPSVYEAEQGHTAKSTLTIPLLAS